MDSDVEQRRLFVCKGCIYRLKALPQEIPCLWDHPFEGMLLFFCKQFFLSINSLKGIACLSANKAIGTIKPCMPVFLSTFKDIAPNSR